MGLLGGLGTGLAAIGPFIPGYGTTLAAIGAAAAGLDPEDTSGNVLLPPQDPFQPENLLWGVPGVLDGWSRSEIQITESKGGVQYVNSITKLLGGGYLTGNPKHAKRAAEDAAKYGSMLRAGGQARLVPPSGQNTRWMREIGLELNSPGSDGLKGWRTPMNNFGPPLGGPIQDAKDLLDRWATRLQAVQAPHFWHYLDTRAWADSAVTSASWNTWGVRGRSFTSWERECPLQNSYGKPPAFSAEEWEGLNVGGVRERELEEREAALEQHHADEEAWHDWRFAAAVQLAQETAEAELTSAFSSYVQEALAAGYGEHAAMQYAMEGLGAQIGGTAPPPPPASPDYAIALQQAQNTYNEAVQEEVHELLAAQTEITPTATATPPKPEGLAAAAIVAAVGILLAR
jgi:hypothetical protein